MNEFLEQRLLHYVEGIRRLEICRSILGFRPVLTAEQFDLVREAGSVEDVLAVYRLAMTMAVGAAMAGTSDGDDHPVTAGLPEFVGDRAGDGVVHRPQLVGVRFEKPRVTILVTPLSGIKMNAESGRHGSALDPADPVTAALAVATKYHHWGGPGIAPRWFFRPADPRVAARPVLERLGLPAHEIRAMLDGYVPDEESWALEVVVWLAERGDLGPLQQALREARER